MKKLKIGIVGCGAIGSSLGKAIMKDFSSDARLTALFDKDITRAQRLNKIISPHKNLIAKNLNLLIKKSEFIIEASSAQSSMSIARRALSQGRDIMVMSVGGLLKGFDALVSLAKKHQAKIYIPSGAITGIDGLKAAGISRLKSVTLVTRKNPLSFKGVSFLGKKGIMRDNLKKDTVLFYGPAKEAVKHFPQNINVAAVLSLAGLGPDKTYVKIIASPTAKKNIHEVHIESSAGSMFTRTENILHPENPKTSYLAVLSAIAVLRQILTPVRIGA